MQKTTIRKVPLEVWKQQKDLQKIRKKVEMNLSLRNDILREQLLLARKAMNLKQRDVAYRFGWDQSFISKLENGVRRITFVEVEKLAAIYGKQLAEFWQDIPAVKRHQRGS